MTLKVVRIGGAQKALQPRTEAGSVQAQSNNASNATKSGAVLSSDAAVSTLRSSAKSQTQNSEKIQEFKEAKGLAKDIAGKIREGADRDTAHGDISSTSTREHLVN
jgi:hypothetical protein